MTKKSFLLLIMLVAMTTGIKAEIGDFIFVKVNGYDMKFEVISDTEVTVWGGGASRPCIDQNVEGAITIPQPVTNPDDGKTYTVTEIKEYAFTFCKKITQVTIPEGVKRVGSSSFMHCTSLTNVTLPNSLEILGEQVFMRCALQSVYIPKNVNTIYGAFNMETLEHIYLDSGNPYFYVIDDVLYQHKDNGKATLIQYPGNKPGTSFTAPSNVDEIGHHAFEFTKNIKTCILPDGVKKIDHQAFTDSSIESVDLPESLELIGVLAFYNSQLKSIDIPARTEIYASSFEECSNLREVILNNIYQYREDHKTFKSIAEDAVLYVPVKYLSNYNKNPWKEWFSTIKTFVLIDETHFPDAAFRTALLENYDLDSNGRFMENDIAETLVLDDYLWDIGIEDLTGIEYFTELTELAFGINKVKRVDLSQNTKLKSIHCEANQIFDEDMDYFIEHLPTVPSGTLYVLDNTKGVTDLNEMTIDQVIVANQKGWTVKIFNPVTKKYNNTAGFWQIREKWFPDAALRHALNEIQFLYGNTVVTMEDAMNREELDLGGETEIQDLTGIELFTGLSDLYFTNNKVKRADLSKNTNLTRIGCELNQMSGDDMDYFVNHLPQAAGDTRKISVYRGSDSSFAEGNEMTPEQVAVANGKGWTVTVYNDIENKDCETDGFWRITESRFPDPVFRQMLDTSFRCKGALTKEDVNEVEEFDLTGLGISDLKGIEYFTELESLLVSCNLLTTINFSMNNKLTSMEICKNNIKGEGMDALIASLPTVSTGEGSMAVYDTSGDYPEGNIMTPEQVAEAKSKRWFPKAWDSKTNKWVDYDGAGTPTGIGETVSLDDQESPAYNLNGQRVNRDYRGIVIRKGRKTLNN